MTTSTHRLALGAALLAAACSRAPEPGSGQRLASTSDAVFVNGDFEGDAVGTTPPTGWTLQNYLNSSGVSGTSAAPPSSFAALNLSGLGTAVNETYVVGGTTYGQTDPDLGPGQPFRYPLYGTRAARVNYKDATTYGKNKNANVLKQTMNIGPADVDPGDGLVHIRFAIAPVLENPSHAWNQQPFYYVELKNLTRGTTLYSGFNVAGQAGVPWRTTTSVATGNATQWLDWQLIDMAPGDAALGSGDQVQLTVVGSGCSLGGHFGRVYVDGLGSVIPGPFVTGSVPASVNAGSTLTYTLRYGNGSTTTAIGAHVDFVTPPNTTFASTSATGCTTPTAGQAGTISCPVGTLAQGASGSFTITVNVSASATGSIVAGNYLIASATAPTLLGAKLTTTVNASGTHYADVVVTQVAAVTAVQPPQTWSSPNPLYTVTVTNTSTTDQIRKSLGRTITVSDVIPSQLTGVTWDCTASVAGSGTGTATKCRDASGAGNTNFSGTGNSIVLTPRLGYAGGQITIKIYGTLASGVTGPVVNTSTASAPSGTIDPNLANNSVTTTIGIGTPRALTVTKTGGAYGTVTSAPAGISCGSACSSSYADGTTVVLSATPVAGASFTGWSGAGVPASCTTGAPATCTVTLSAALGVNATFTAPPAAGPATQVWTYSGSGQAASTGTAFASPLRALVTDANGTPVSGATVTFTPPGSGASATVGAGTAISNSSGIATLSATANATAGSYTITATVPGGTRSAAFSLTNVGPPASITFVNGGDTTDPQIAPTGTTFASPLVAIVKDAAGNVVPGVTVTYTVVPVGGASATLTSGASSGSTVTATTDAFGNSSITATANATVGSYTVTASVAGVATPATFHLQNVTAGPAAVFVVSGTPQIAPVSTAFANPLVVTVADASGNSLPNVTVGFAATTVGGATATLSGASATTSASGLASVTATANATGGTYAVNATVSGVGGSGVFTLTNDGGGTLSVQAGSPQSTTVGTAFSTQLQALLLDDTGAAVAGQVVTFQAPTSGATATLSGGSACVPAATGCRTATTNASGIASVTATANGVSGSYSVSGSTPSAPNPISFSLSNQCTADTQCSGPAPICNTTSHVCQACSSGAQCSAKDASAPYCDGTSGGCVGCRADSDCSGAAPICSQATQTCSACVSDAQCAGRDAAMPYCLGTGACTAGFTLTASAGANGTITPSGALTVAPGASASFTIAPSTGYLVQGVLVDGASVGTPASYTFTNVQASHTIDASFSIQTFTITTSAGAGGTVSPSGAQTVSYGGSLPVTITPSTGHHVVDVTVDGTSVGAVGVYTFSSVVASHTLAATFGADPVSVSGSAGPGGTVTCPSTVPYGQPATCSVVPDAGYAVATLTDGGVDVLSQLSGTTYVAPNVTAPRTIAATFKKVLGISCSADTDCGSGHCTDGVCCDTSCAGQCEACDVAGSAGTCSPVSGSPRGGRSACASDGSACGGSCNGVVTNGCTYPGNPTSCRGATCAAGVATLAASCDGAGSCPAAQTVDCAPLTCGATACLGGCSVDADCASGSWCAAGVCTPRKGSGAACGGADQCASGFCADGVCCDQACGGQCEACDASGSVGTCTPVAGAPHGGRAACETDGTFCGGACDGTHAGGCSYPTTSCRSASCSAGVATLGASCDGAGHCPVEQTETCAPYTCGATACLGNCTVDADCGSGSWCSAGVCSPRKTGGEACGGASQCATGSCVDGVCCDTACNGQCEACDVPGSAGTCTPVAGAPHGARAACATDGSVCGGACDGTNAASCAYPAAETDCRAGACADGVATQAAACDGAGTCPAAQQVGCAPYACGATSCRGDCTADGDCAGGNYCAAGVCSPVKGPGEACSAADQCGTGSCVDGVCCDTACDGQCEACDVAGSVGTCSPVAGPPHGARTACASDGSACAGSCDGSQRTSCAYPDGSVTCRAGACADGVVTQAASCDGAGACPASQQNSCGGFACDGDACRTSCSDSSECAEGHTCAGGTCTPGASLEGLRVAGSGCSCGGGPASAWVLFWLLGFLPFRRAARPARPAGGSGSAAGRGAIIAVLLVAGLSAAPARAQTASFDLERFRPEGGAHDVLSVPSASVPGHLERQGMLWASYADEPLRLVSADGGSVNDPLVKAQTTFQVGGSLGLLDRYEIALMAPVVVTHGDNPSQLAGSGITVPQVDTAFGDLSIAAKAHLLDAGPFGLALGVPLRLPTGKARSYSGHAGLTGGVEAIGEWHAPGDSRGLFRLGWVGRGDRQLVDLTVSSAVTWGLAGEVPLPLRIGGSPVVALGSLAGEVELSSGSAVERPMELLLAARARFPAGLTVTLGAGPGIGEGYGTPRFRVVTSVGFSPPRRPVEAAAAPAPAPAPAARAPELPPPSPIVVAAAPLPAPQPPPAPAPAPEPAPQVVVTSEKVLILQQVHFANDRDVILEESYPLLEEVARVLGQNPQLRKLRVEGHTDSKGAAAHNRSLSERRARNVRAFLVGQGIAPGRLVSKGYGPDRPVAPNVSPEGRARNRRVEFVILEQG